VADLPELERDLIHQEDYVVVIDADGCWWKKKWYDCDTTSSSSGKA